MRICLECHHRKARGRNDICDDCKAKILEDQKKKKRSVKK